MAKMNYLVVDSLGSGFERRRLPRKKKKQIEKDVKNFSIKFKHSLKKFFPSKYLN